MKIFVLYELATHKIVGFSEDKNDVLKYVLERSLDPEVYDFTKVTKRMAERISMDFEDLYIEHDSTTNRYLTRVEISIIDDVFDDEQQRLDGTKEDLEHYLKNYALSEKDQAVLMKALKIIKNTKRRKKLAAVLELDKFVGYMTRRRNIVDAMRQRLHEMSEKMMIFIKVKE